MIPTDPYVFIYQIIYPLLLSSFFGLLIRLSLTFTNQKWATTFHHTITYILLPSITFIVTKVISGNIALSLGMVGALSIVRFRNPVKSPFELVIYFALITIGISSSINIFISLVLTIFIITAIIVLYLLSKIENHFSINIFHNQFDEGPNKAIVDLVLSKEDKNLLERKELINSLSNKIDNTYMYKFYFNQRNLAINFKKDLSNHKDLLSIEFNQ